MNLNELSPNSRTDFWKQANALNLDEKTQQFHQLLDFFLEEEERFLIALEAHESQQDGEACMINAREEREIDHLLSLAK